MTVRGYVRYGSGSVGDQVIYSVVYSQQRVVHAYGDFPVQVQPGRPLTIVIFLGQLLEEQLVKPMMCLCGLVDLQPPTLCSLQADHIFWYELGRCWWVYSRHVIMNPFDLSPHSYGPLILCFCRLLSQSVIVHVCYRQTC